MPLLILSVKQTTFLILSMYKLINIVNINTDNNDHQTYE